MRQILNSRPASEADPNLNLYWAADPDSLWEASLWFTLGRSQGRLNGTHPDSSYQMSECDALRVRIVLARWEDAILRHPEGGGPAHYPGIGFRAPTNMIPAQIGSPGPGWRSLRLRNSTNDVTLARTNAPAVLCRLAKRLSDSWGLPMRPNRTGLKLGAKLAAKPARGPGRPRKRQRESSSEEADFVVESIIGKRVSHDNLGFEWHIKWLGFDGTDEECSWEPLECLVGCQNILYQYEAGLSPEVQKELQAELVALLAAHWAKKAPGPHPAIQNNPFEAIAAAHSRR